MVKDLKASKK
jgi:nucleolar protein 15